MDERFEAVGQHLGGGKYVLSNWPPLLLVAVEEARRRTATMNQRQLPGQVVRVLDAGVHALSAHRAVNMHRVTSQKDAFVAVMSRGPVVDTEVGQPAWVADSDAGRSSFRCDCAHVFQAGLLFDRIVLRRQISCN